MTITALVHCDSKGLIGTNGGLAYKSREDHLWFKSFTQGKHLVMGRKTYTECGNLPSRGILCLSSSGNLYNGIATKRTVESLGKYNVVICGGAKVYEQYLPICNEVIVNYTKQTEKQPGLKPTYFNLSQLNELFIEVQKVEYNTFTQVIYKLKTKIASKYLSTIKSANLKPEVLEQEQIMQYYVISSLSQKISYKTLIAGYDFKGNLSYYLNPEAREDDTEYYDTSQVFEDYNDALAYFCQMAAAELAYHKAQIALIEKIKNEVLEL